MSDDIWLRRQHALAEFGARALASSHIDGLLGEACRLVAQGLDSPIAKVLKQVPDDGLLLCAAHGIPRDVAEPGKTRVSGDTKSAAGYSVKTRKPVLSHVASETRFDAGDIVRMMGVTYSINVPICCEDVPYGALEADRTDERPYNEDDVNFLLTYANVLGAAIQNHRNTQRIEALLGTQKLLFSELQHRVKNDLQIILILIELQQRRVTGEEAREHLNIILGRIDALRLVHERMFAGKSLDGVDLAEYLGLLSATRFQMHGLEPAGPIKLTTEIAPVTIDHDLAVSLGLIANEFLTNSLKHAFPDGSGTISINGTSLENHRLRLTFADDGKGQVARSTEAGSGTGQRLIAMLSRQIDAEVVWKTERGTSLELTFSV